FRAVAESGSFRQGALIARVTQPSLTRSIQILESVLDCKLFYRSSRGVDLTEAGRSLLKLCKEIWSQVVTYEALLKDPSIAWAGTVRVGTYEYLLKLLWGETLLRMSKDYPELQINLIVRSGFVPHSINLEKEFDVIVDVEPIKALNLHSVQIFNDTFCFYRSPKYSYEKKSNLRNSTLIFVPSAIDAYRINLQERLLQLNLEPQRRYEVDTFESCRHLALSGLGVVILPRSLGEREVRLNKLVEVAVSRVPPTGFGRHSIYATILAGRKDDPKIQLVISCLKQVYENRRKI
ncbi:MAG: LysR family transcriptional regulator, partial [Proteobacteria bacterium]|nr:LysR family transcriptional regulator [Pseudomonadota bacterium]